MDFVFKNIKKVNVLIRKYHTDLVSIQLDDTTAFPDLKYDTWLNIDCQKGKGVDFCKKYLGVDPEIISDCLSDEKE